jgi:hypothetical protein
MLMVQAMKFSPFPSSKGPKKKICSWYSKNGTDDCVCNVPGDILPIERFACT